MIRRKKRLPTGGLTMMNLLEPSSEGAAAELPQLGVARLVLVWRVKPVAEDGQETMTGLVGVCVMVRSGAPGVWIAAIRLQKPAWRV